MVLMKKFFKSKDDDYENMSVVTGSMRLVLKGLSKGMIPHENYTEDQILDFCRSLIENQAPDGSWPVYKDKYAESISEEDKIDFLYFPTQIACAVLSYVKQNFSSSSKLGNLDEALSAGLRFSVSRNLEGYGFNSPFQKIESLHIFIEGSVIELLNSDPRICPSCYNRLIEIKEDLIETLEKGETAMEYGGDYREQYELVLKGLENI
ncbi:hypothetical protein [Spirochaeta isovalerica]|uniref:Uncharacterized protein n=1 Tax=Spirochaeta isovalerica TaxID=150 RepID=A0A841RH17_9SPIO|nr:hypothetical protein [Spirochaeta isovalerica]MBB6482079.1 hypothetical protein [Spirochaeta isovalerica]